MLQIIDLTYELREGMPTFNAAWHPIVSITQLGRLDFEGRTTRKITIGSHTGTHVDAPLHFIRDGGTVDQIPLIKLMGDVTIVDFSYLKENAEVTEDMLKNFTFQKRVLFNFGWGKHWGTKKFYKGYPFFSLAAATYLISCNVELIGMDTPSPDDSSICLSGDVLGSAADSPIHKLLLCNDVVLLEYVAHLDKVSDLCGWKIIAMPIKILGADGAPARVCIYKED